MMGDDGPPCGSGPVCNPLHTVRKPAEEPALGTGGQRKGPTARPQGVLPADLQRGLEVVIMLATPTDMVTLSSLGTLYQ